MTKEKDMDNKEAKSNVYSVPVIIHCPNCGAEISVVYHQRTTDDGAGHVSCDIPDIYDHVFCTRCSYKII